MILAFCYQDTANYVLRWSTFCQVVNVHNVPMGNQWVPQLFRLKCLNHCIFWRLSFCWSCFLQPCAACICSMMARRRRLYSCTMLVAWYALGGGYWRGFTPIPPIPLGWTKIPERFGAGSKGVTLIIPDSVTHIEDSAFSNCRSLQTLTIPNSVTHIGEAAFRSCSSLKTLTIPNSVKKIGRFAFHSCSSLVTLTIPKSVTSIGQFAFSGCSSLKALLLPSSVTEIGEHTFSGCSSLQRLKIPSSVIHIGNSSFFGCIALRTLRIPKWCDKECRRATPTRNRCSFDVIYGAQLNHSNLMF